ncbi:MAG: SIS domain-containing protein [Candidatus Paceibacterota bacterium]
MEKDILNFPSQFSYQPEIINENNLRRRSNIIVLGMGGSHLAAGLLKSWDNHCSILIHWDYGLPAISDEQLADSLIIAISHSGKTEEILSGLAAAQKKGLTPAVISSGGPLITEAKNASLPYIQIPADGLQPRLALGFMLKSLLKLAGFDEKLTATEKLVNLTPTDWQKPGQALAEKLAGKIPIIYASPENGALAYNWKIKFNETGKVPAFYNLLPELNHNEMNGFAAGQTKVLSSNFAFLLLADEEDRPEIKKRLAVLTQVLTAGGHSVTTLPLTGKNRLFRLFNSLLYADWTTYYTALAYGQEPAAVPLIEEFKRQMAE